MALDSATKQQIMTEYATVCRPALTGSLNDGRVDPACVQPASVTETGGHT